MVELDDEEEAWPSIVGEGVEEEGDVVVDEEEEVKQLSVVTGEGVVQDGEDVVDELLLLVYVDEDELVYEPSSSIPGVAVDELVEVEDDMGMGVVDELLEVDELELGSGVVTTGSSVV